MNNLLEKTLLLYQILDIPVSVDRVQFFEPMFEILKQYNPQSLGMIGRVETLSTYSLTNHHLLANKCEWIIEDQDPLIKLSITMITTENIEKYVVYIYKDSLKIKEFYKKYLQLHNVSFDM